MGVILKMEICYCKLISINDLYVVFKVYIKEVKCNIVIIEVCFYNKDEELCIEVFCIYFIFLKEKVREEMYFLLCEVEDEEIFFLI